MPGRPEDDPLLPGSPDRGGPAETEYDGEAYKKTKWAEMIDDYLNLEDRYESIAALAQVDDLARSILQQHKTWANWMIREGHCLSDMEVQAKHVELLQRDGLHFRARASTYYGVPLDASVLESGLE